MPIIGRDKEQQELDEFLSSENPEFLAVYGRRRIGKTFLIREFFKNKKAIFFNATGSKDASLAEQIRHFTQEIGTCFYAGAVLKPGKNWDDTFALLTRAIATIPKNKKIVLFLDEFPWMATHKARLLENLDYYWNQHWSRDSRIKLIICGSSASWIIGKIINNKGGLHNRMTKQMLLEPFKLYDTKRFLSRRGVVLNHKQIVQIYMAMGGIPYYLNNIQKGLSATEIIQNLAFSRKGFLLGEFDNLFSSLFVNHEISIEMIRIIAQYQYGIGQELLFKKVSKNIKGKVGLAKLKELEDASFITSFKPHLHKKRGLYYKVTDEYTLFYLRWIEPIKETLLKKHVSLQYWKEQVTSPAWHAWAGLAFESICYKHLSQISECLKLSPTAIPDFWRETVAKGSQESGAQIDLLFDRADGAMTVCEIKYTEQPWVIDKAFAEKLRQKIDVFLRVTQTKKQIFLAMISASGVKKTMYSEAMLSGLVSLDDLFQKEH